MLQGLFHYYNFKHEINLLNSTLSLICCSSKLAEESKVKGKYFKNMKITEALNNTRLFYNMLSMYIYIYIMYVICVYILYIQAYIEYICIYRK